MKTYPKYKDSGVEWLGEVPEGWAMSRLKNLFFLEKRPVRANDEIITAFRDGTVTLRKNRREDGFTNALHEIGYQGVRKGDLVIHAMDGFAGAIGVSDSDGKSTPVYSICTAKSDVHPQYYGRLLRHMALSGYVSALARGIRERSTEFRWNDASVVTLPLPPLPEQRAIAAFLDHEVAKIDELIAEQERLIELLAEKCQATISHAVTKGLNPQARLKPSGVAWLGDVPEDWELGSLKRYVDSMDSRRIPLSSTERGEKQGDYPYYGASGVIDYVDDFIFDETTILVSEDGANLVNRNTPIAFLAHGKYWVNNHAHILTPKDEQFDFWCFRIESVDLIPYISGSAQPKLTIEALLNIQISVPKSISERLEISNFVKREIEKFDPLIRSALEGIKLLQERRAALISAAVTGKIDVRAHQAGLGEVA